MTKKKFAEHLVQFVHNSIEFDGKLFSQIVEDMEAQLSILEPKDRERFADWGQPNERSTTAKCWD